ncbi:hypothetical protein UA38_05560 [Photobacterium kishitanii]|uniref:GntR family transcriptional regulator n=1 Tax=Photobacterium kishitanii TaxID=318456 RepID=A0AAX0Z054_9GAMM|nr:GntR family transcriptional regulator [Photobacterium kishitanii]KJG11185.1 hypothetical protein UB40_00680 [Photobacterium kishitanii]KJG58720.1 hypothetical protein UA38_05560 [Photobacterium kishitanii]KJG62753.1 hypothetical protein UA42_04480 [Photobacterium kishitanii]KJG66650.1 hypothetical protein UA40_06360 [Photobacterium kishitanii]KJG70995.1 hypothetical protein UA41_04115 [Photobacterium kishitanii]
MKPIYLRIFDDLFEKIQSQIYTEGDMLPTELELQHSYGVSRVTVRKTLALLVEQGVVTRIKGRGTFVKNPCKATHNAIALRGFYQELNAQGKTPSSDVLTFEILEPDSIVAEKLKLTANERVYHIVRIRNIDGEPEMMERTYMPVALFPDLTLQVMMASKYAYIESKGYKIANSYQSIMPEMPDRELAKLLNVTPTTPLLKAISTGELADGCLFEYTINYFTLKQYSFEFIATR